MKKENGVYLQTNHIICHRMSGWYHDLVGKKKKRGSLTNKMVLDGFLLKVFLLLKTFKERNNCAPKTLKQLGKVLCFQIDEPVVHAS